MSDTTQVFAALILFLPLNCDSMTSLSRLKYERASRNMSFISFFLNLSNFQECPDTSTSFISSPFINFISSLLRNLPRFSTTKIIPFLCFGQPTVLLIQSFQSPLYSSFHCLWKVIRKYIPCKETTKPVYKKYTKLLVEEFNKFLTSVGVRTANLSEKLEADSTSIPAPFLKLGKGKGPGIGWSHDTQIIWV